MKVFLLVGFFQMAVACSGEAPCSSQPHNFASCDVDHETCTGPVACRSCNGALGLWDLEPAWACTCATNTVVGGKTGLYWQCVLRPVCTPGPGTFTDSQCTMAADAGSG